MSCWGMPSVMHTTRSRPASTPSRMACAANGGGTYNTDAVAPVFFTASCMQRKQRLRSSSLVCVLVLPMSCTPHLHGACAPLADGCERPGIKCSGQVRPSLCITSSLLPLSQQKLCGRNCILPAVQAQNDKGRSSWKSGLTCTLLKTGRPRWVLPPFLGLTPPTIWVPYAMACTQSQLSYIGSRHCMNWCRLRKRAKIPSSSVSYCFTSLGDQHLTIKHVRQGSPITLGAKYVGGQYELSLW